MFLGDIRAKTTDTDALGLREQIAYLRFLIASNSPSTLHEELAVKSYKAILQRLEAELERPLPPDEESPQGATA